MSVLLTNPVYIHPYQPGPPYESQYPIGEWRGTGVIGGDASGGYVEITFAPASAQEANNFIWSWEGASVRFDANLAVQLLAVLTLITAEPLTPLGGSTEIYIRSAYIPAVAARATAGLLMEKWPASLSKLHHPQAGLTNSFSIAIDGNVAGVVHRFSAFGYVWHPQVRIRAGGPRRP